jgi:hypothetical protein
MSAYAAAAAAVRTALGHLRGMNPQKTDGPTAAA